MHYDGRNGWCAIAEPRTGFLLIKASAGTNKWKFHLTTLMVIDEFGHGVPAAWLLHKYEDAEVIRSALDALALNVSGVEQSNPDHARLALAAFCPKYFVIDASKAETNAVETSIWGKAGDSRGDVPQTKVVYCLWHAKRAILKNLKSKMKVQGLFGSIWRHVEALLGINVCAGPYRTLTPYALTCIRRISRSLTLR